MRLRRVMSDRNDDISGDSALIREKNKTEELTTLVDNLRSLLDKSRERENKLISYLEECGGEEVQ